MTVDELIEKLKAVEGKTPVYIDLADHNFMAMSNIYQKFDSDKKDSPKVVLTWRVWNYQKEVF